MFEPSGSLRWTASSLEIFESVNGHQLWSSTLTEDKQELVGRRFKRFGVNLDVSPKKAKCVVCLFRNAIYVCIP